MCWDSTCNKIAEYLNFKARWRKSNKYPNLEILQNNLEAKLVIIETKQTSG